MAENVNETENGKSLGHNIFRELLPIEQRSVLGTVLIVATLLVLAWVGITETNRMQEFDDQYQARAIQRGAATFAGNCSTCHGPYGRGIEGKAPPLNYEGMFDGTRLEEIGYAGSLTSYLEGTVAAGRPTNSGGWPNPMPTWSQTYGGPMRPDEVRDVVAFMLNWGCFYDDTCIDPDEHDRLEAIYGGEVTPPSAAGAEPTPAGPAFPPDWDWDEFAASLPEGDPAHGEELFQPAALTCAACHSVDGTTIVGPSLQGIKDRLPEDVDPQTIEGYIAQSVWDPAAYFVPGFEGVVMPAGFRERMDGMEGGANQNLADIIAYLLTLE